jgi:formylglycine-generating enzyme required for sulfatase activity
MSYNLTAIRQLVAAAFSDDDLRVFCFDHFPAVYQDFTAGQTQGQRVLLLVDFATRHGQLDTLLDAIEKANPYQFDTFRAEVRSEGGPDSQSKSFEPETIYVPAGPFLMGDDPGEGIPEYETPQHTVTLPAYRIGRFPVTNRQYAEFIRREKAQDVPKDAGWFLREPPADRLDHPVTGVSWGDAVAYCRWLSSQCGHRYRLPSEAEWEKAAAPAPTPPPNSGEGLGKRAARLYPWGPEWIDGLCNVNSAGTTPVTAHPAGASPCGCEDMLGNIQEWTATLWGTQPAQPQQSYRDQPAGGPSITDPVDLPAQARLVHRGGSYKSQPDELRCSARGSAAPDSRIPWRGFRVAMEV